MMLHIHPSTPAKNKILKAVECLKNGGIIIYPTDTVYSFGCDISSKKGIQKLAEIRGNNDGKNHFSLVCHDLKVLSEFTSDINQASFKLMKRTLPGPFIYILKANKYVPKIFNFNKHTIGIRVPDNNIARALAGELGRPIVSATVLSDESDSLPYLTDPMQIFERYKKIVDLMINGGPGDHTASTVVDISNGAPQVIRQGKGLLRA